VNSSVGLTGSAGDGARRAERFGTNRLASREEVTFAQMVLDALQVMYPAAALRTVSRKLLRRSQGC